MRGPRTGRCSMWKALSHERAGRRWVTRRRAGWRHLCRSFWWAFRRAQTTYSKAVVQQLKATGPVVIGCRTAPGPGTLPRREVSGRLFAKGRAVHRLDGAEVAHLEVIVRPAQLSVPPLKKNATPREVAERDEKLKAIAEFRALIAERRTWAFRRTAGSDSSGRSTTSAPAGPATATAATAPSPATCPRAPLPSRTRPPSRPPQVLHAAHRDRLRRRHPQDPPAPLLGQRRVDRRLRAPAPASRPATAT